MNNPLIFLPFCVDKNGKKKLCSRNKGNASIVAIKYHLWSHIKNIRLLIAQFNCLKWLSVVFFAFCSRSNDRMWKLLTTR